MRSNKLSICVILLLFIGFLACSNEAPTAEPKVEKSNKSDRPAFADQKVILFFGNSLTAAYGLDREDGFTSLIQNKIETDNKAYRTVNAGLSGETSAGGLNRIDWILDRQPIDIFVLELGANDGLRGTDPESTYKNLKGIVNKVAAKYPSCRFILAGMQAPPNMGKDYTDAFKNIYPRLAKELKMALIPFLLEGVAGDPKLNQKDGIHPTAEAQVILTENIWKILGPML